MRSWDPPRPATEKEFTKFRRLVNCPLSDGTYPTLATNPLIVIGPFPTLEFISLFRVVNGYNYWKEEETLGRTKCFSWELPSLRGLTGRKK